MKSGDKVRINRAVDDPECDECNDCQETKVGTVRYTDAPLPFNVYVTWSGSDGQNSCYFKENELTIVKED
jgi:hypothetical protein